MPIASKKNRHGKDGFTLIELLIVIGIIAILAAIVLVAVDPAKRLKDARDARRFAEVNGLLNAVLNYTVDNAGTLPSAIGSSATANQPYMIGTAGSGCGGTAPGCPASVTGGTNTYASCANLGVDLVDKYIGSIPVDPRGSDATGTAYTAAQTGYFITKSTNGRITIGSCNPEDTASISVKR